MATPFDPFHSPRLTYRAVEDTPEDELFINKIQSDAEAQSAAQFNLLVPENRTSSNKFRDHLRDKALLGVIICLAPVNPSDTPQPIGAMSLRAPASAASAHHRNSYIGIDVLRPFQGKGYGSEAIEWVLGYGFQFAGLHRIGIEAFSYNPGALRLYERLGFVPEGRRREEVWFNGAWHDIITFGMLEHEWRESQANGGRKWGQ